MVRDRRVNLRCTRIKWHGFVYNISCVRGHKVWVPWLQRLQGSSFWWSGLHTRSIHTSSFETSFSFFYWKRATSWTLARMLALELSSWYPQSSSWANKVILRAQPFKCRFAVLCHVCLHHPKPYVRFNNQNKENRQLGFVSKMHSTCHLTSDFLQKAWKENRRCDMWHEAMLKVTGNLQELIKERHNI